MASRLRSGNRRSIASDIIRVMSRHGGVIRARSRDIAVIPEDGEGMDRAFKFTRVGLQPAFRVLIRRILVEDITPEMAQLFRQPD
jgi:hypothetical protein